MLFRKVLVSVIGLLLFYSSSVVAGEMKILTENYPPFNYEKDGKIKGISTAIVNAILKDIGQDRQIERLSWNRAYELISNEPGYVLFSMARNSKRENMFKWVGPLYQIPGFYYKKKGGKVHVATLDDVKNNASVGVRENSNVHHSLIDDGFKHIVALENPEAYYRGLYFDRIDLVISSPWNLPFRAKKFDIPFESFERTPVRAGTGTLYIAFSKQTPDDVIQQWQQSLNRLRDSGEFDKLMNESLAIVSEDYGVKFKLPENE